MYVWTAIDVDNQLKEVKELAQIVEKEIGFEKSAFSLPSHISLKISFAIDGTAYASVIKTITDYYQTLSPFCIDVDGIEVENNIVWIRIKESVILHQIHKDLDRILMEKHGIAPHPFDLDFKFHSTLFLDFNKEKIATAFEKIKGAKIPLTLRADTLIIGSSPSGEIGTYCVDYKIHLCKNSPCLQKNNGR